MRTQALTWTLVEVAQIAFSGDAIQEVSFDAVKVAESGRTHIALMDEMSKPNRPPPITEMAAMR
jgi:hypothetical protein